MNRVSLLLVVCLLLALAAYVLSKRAPILSVFLFTFALLLALLLIGSAFDWIPL